jgi:hypothetical protein
MAITNVIDGVKPAVVIANATAFTVLDPTTATADGFAVGEFAQVFRLGPNGDYSAATNKDGYIILSVFPNTVLLDAPATYKIIKTATTADAYVGYGV